LPHRSGRRGRRARGRGFGYLGLLFFIAITAAALAALGQRWSTAAQRERERELVFRGQAIARAIERYGAALPERPAYPERLEDLVEDRRSLRPRHHLRQRYADPFTGEADWELIAAPPPASGFIGVRSRSDRPLLMSQGPDGQPVERANGLQFMAQPLPMRGGPR
jgi:type II secretory pathway pseudopilin PulG